MRHLVLTTIALLSMFALQAQEKKVYSNYDRYLTVWDGRSKDHLTLQADHEFIEYRKAWNARIVIDPSIKKNPILGFGSSLMDSDIYNLMRMSAQQRDSALRALFDPNQGANWNVMRIAFGSDGWDRDWNFYTYNDMPEGQTDIALNHFTVKKDEEYGHFQIFREILAINPNVKFIASVWSPPAWMKDSKQLVSNGKVLPEYYNAFARYLVKCVRAYEERGIPVYSVTVQNEPMCNYETNYPQALYMDWRDLRDLNVEVATVFKKENINTQLWIYDYNFDAAQDYALPLMRDPSLKGLFQGVAWHYYSGHPEEIEPIIAEFADIPMYMTERVNYDIEGMAKVIRCLRSGLQCYVQWVTISDEYDGPYQWAGGSEHITVPAPQVHKYKALYNIRKAPDIWYKTWAYYNFAQLTTFVQSGARRIHTNETENNLYNVAFLNPDGSIVLVIVNTGKEAISINIQIYGEIVDCELPKEATCTLIFK